MNSVKDVSLLRTLFDPFSKDWNRTSLEEKCHFLNKFFIRTGITLNKMDTYLRGFCYFFRSCDLEEARNFNYEKILELHRSDFSSEAEKIDLPNLVFGVGLYLSKALDANFYFPISPSDIELIKENLNYLNDKRKKRTKKLRALIFESYHGNTREFFDLLSTEGKRSNLAEKRGKLTKALLEGFSMIEVLLFHYIHYSSMKNYEHVAFESPYSAFALIWDEDKLLLEN